MTLKMKGRFLYLKCCLDNCHCVFRLSELCKKISVVLQRFVESSNKKSHLYLAEKRFMDVLFGKVRNKWTDRMTYKWMHKCMVKGRDKQIYRQRNGQMITKWTDENQMGVM